MSVFLMSSRPRMSESIFYLFGPSHDKSYSCVVISLGPGRVGRAGDYIYSLLVSPSDKSAGGFLMSLGPRVRDHAMCHIRLLGLEI